jgi:hypothetical protein
MLLLFLNMFIILKKEKDPLEVLLSFLLYYRPRYYKYHTSQSFLHVNKLNHLNVLSMQKDAFLLKKSVRLWNLSIMQKMLILWQTGICR